MTDANATAAFERLADELEAEHGRTTAAHEALRRLDPHALTARANEREQFNHTLAQSLRRARQALAELCTQLNARGDTLQDLELAAPTEATRVREAVERAKAAGRTLDALDASDRVLWQRALTIVRQLASRLPTRADTYGRHGSSPNPVLASSTTTTTA